MSISWSNALDKIAYHTFPTRVSFAIYRVEGSGLVLVQGCQIWLGTPVPCFFCIKDGWDKNRPGLRNAPKRNAGQNGLLLAK